MTEYVRISTPSRSASWRGVAHRAHVEAHDDRVGGRRQVDVGLGDAADAGQHDRDLDLVLRQLGDLVLEGLERAGHVGLEHEAELVEPAALVEDRRERALDAAAARLLLELEAVGALAGERAGLAVVLDHVRELAGLGHGVEAEHLDRLGRTGRLDALARVVGHRADAAPVGAGDDRVADLQRAALDEHGDDGATARIELGLDHGAGGVRVRVGGELLELGRQLQALEQVVEALRASWPRRRRTSCRRPTPRAGARAGSSRCARGRARRLPCRSC